MNVVDFFIENLDFFSCEPKLLINQKRCLRSYSAGLLSFIYLTSIICVSIIYLWDIFFFKNISISSNEEQNNDPKINLSSLPIYFQFYNKSNDNLILNDPERYFKFSMQYSKINFTNDKIKGSVLETKEINLKKCNDIFSEKFNNNNKNNSNVIKDDSIDDFTYYGKFNFFNKKLNKII